jgi:hypothetical protein
MAKTSRARNPRQIHTGMAPDEPGQIRSKNQGKYILRHVWANRA